MKTLLKVAGSVVFIFSILLSPFSSIVSASPALQIKITVHCPLSQGEVGKPYGSTLSSTGGIEPLHWAITSGALPPGLSLDSASGLIAGTPTVNGNFVFSFMVYDAHQASDGSVQCSITILQAPPPTPTHTPTVVPFDFDVDALEEIVVLDPNQPPVSGENRVEADQTVKVRLLSGRSQSGQLSLLGVPDGVGYDCDVLTGYPPFTSQCAFYLEDIDVKPLEGDFPIEARMNIHNLVRSDTFTLRIPLFNDIRITEVKPVQVVYDADLHGVLTLVKGKGTAFKILVNSTYTEPVNVEFLLDLPESEWYTAPPSTGMFFHGTPAGWEFPDNWGPITINPGDNEVILPYLDPSQSEVLFTEDLSLPGLIEGRCVGNVCGPDVRVMPRPDVIGEVHYAVAVDPANSLGERNTANNSLSGTADSIGTRPWNFYVVTYKNVANVTAPPQDDIENGAKHQLEYLLALFPIADSELRYTIAPLTNAEPCPYNHGLTCGYSITWETRSGGFAGFEDRSQFLGRVADLALSEGYDMGIAMGGGCGGGVGGTSSAFFVGNCGGTYSHKVAHEFNHLMTGMKDIYSLDCLVEWDEAYCEHPDGSRDYYCYEDSLDKRDGYTGINCSLSGDTLVCLPGQVKNCAGSCNCSVYDLNYDSYPVCPGAGVCNASCCSSIGRADCADGTVYNGPDGRIMHPASEGFWVNRYIPVSADAAYIMDSYNPGIPDPVRYWMRLDSTFQHCYEDLTFKDGYLRLLRNTKLLDGHDPEALLVSGDLKSDGSASFNPFLRLTAPQLELEPGEGEGYSIVLQDATGNVLETNFFEPFLYQSDPEAGEISGFHFSFRILWVDGTRKIFLKDPKGVVLAQQNVSQNSPAVTIESPQSGVELNVGEPITVTWKGSDADQDPLSYYVSISTDQKETWLPLINNLKENFYTIDTSGFTEGNELLIKVRVSDGVNTGVAVLTSPIKLSGLGVIKTKEPEEQDKPVKLFLIGMGALWVLVFAIVVWGVLKLKTKTNK